MNAARTAPVDSPVLVPGTSHPPVSLSDDLDMQGAEKIRPETNKDAGELQTDLVGNILLNVVNDGSDGLDGKCPIKLKRRLLMRW